MGKAGEQRLRNGRVHWHLKGPCFTYIYIYIHTYMCIYVRIHMYKTSSDCSKFAWAFMLGLCSVLWASVVVIFCLTCLSVKQDHNTVIRFLGSGKSQDYQ